MKNTIKTVITVLVVVGCGFISLISFGVYLSETDYMEYEIGRMVSPVFKEAEAEYLGNSYTGEEEDGYSYYRVKIVLENNSNYGIDEASLNVHFTMPKEELYLKEYEEVAPFDIWKEGRYYPAGQEALFYKIVCVEDGCKEIDVFYQNYQTDEKQRIPVTLKNA